MDEQEKTDKPAVQSATNTRKEQKKHIKIDPAHNNLGKKAMTANKNTDKLDDNSTGSFHFSHD
jgi:hypothetical protein